MKKYIYVVTAMECDWDCSPINIGTFSSHEIAINWLRENKTVVDITQDETSLIEWVNHRGSRIVFHAYGYDCPSGEVERDENGVYYVWAEDFGEYGDDGSPSVKYKDYFIADMSYTVECFEVDRGV